MLTVVPTTLKLANAVIDAWHRHHKPARGCRFCLAAVDETGQLHGVLIASRPVARLSGDPQHVAEVVRLATNGTKNACSLLYGAAARVAKSMGFEKIQTYILAEEPGTSLIASGWQFESYSQRTGKWIRPDYETNRERREDQPMGLKQRWSKLLNPRSPLVVWPVTHTSAT